MEVVEHKDFDKRNREILSKFIQDAEKNPDDLSGSAMATMAQFIMNLRLTVSQICKDRDWITSIEIIEVQVKELRQCVIDLEAYKERLNQGVVHQ